MILRCKICGGDLEINENDKVSVCKYCGTKQTLPKLDDEKRLHLYDRANHFRRNNEYDKAMGIYEIILNEDGTDAEAYWSLVLCKYGVEYVEDPATHKRVPTCNRTLQTSILADEDYKAAIQYADITARSIYEEEAKTIEQIQRGILAISSKEEDYDIFICYKESDAQGRRTQDSVLAQDIYQQLTREGYRVFFARVTLEDKIGSAYEPYIFAALSSARIMIAVGTQKEHFNAVWVKNEWSRFLAMTKDNPDKLLIPAYRDMDPYDLPDELAHLQAQDMEKIGFVQDLLHGIQKIIGRETKAETGSKVPLAESNIENLIKRIDVFLNDGNYEKAEGYCERVLDIKADEARAYIGMLRVEIGRKYSIKGSEQEMLTSVLMCVENTGHFRKAMQYARAEYKKILQEYAEANRKNVIAHLDYYIEKEPQLKGDIDYTALLTLAQQFDNPEMQPYKNALQDLAKKYDDYRLELTSIRKELHDKEREINSIHTQMGTLNKNRERAQGVEDDERLLREHCEVAKQKMAHAVIALIVFLLATAATASNDSYYSPAPAFAMGVIVCVIILIVKYNTYSTTKGNYEKKAKISLPGESVEIINASLENAKRRLANLNGEIAERQSRISEIENALSPNTEEKVEKDEMSDYVVGTVKFVCDVCGYVNEGKQLPKKCNVCNASGDKMKKRQYTKDGWV